MTDSAPAVFQKPCELQQFLCLFPDLAPLHEIETALVFHDFLHGHILAHGVFLGDHTEPAFLGMGAPVEHIAVQEDPALCGKKNGRQHADRGRLACSVRTQKAEKLSVFDRQVNMIHCRESPEFLCKSLYLNHRFPCLPVNHT